MNPRTALLLLAVGTLIGTGFGLYADLPAVALAGWALCAAACTGLQKAEEAFFVARNGAVFGVVAEAAALTSFAADTADWLRYAGLLTLLAGGASAFGKLFADTFREPAAGRIGSLAFTTLIPLALAHGLVEAGSGPSWTGTVADLLRAAVLLVALWFAAFAVAALDAADARRPVDA